MGLLRFLTGMLGIIVYNSYICAMKKLFTFGAALLYGLAVYAQHTFTAVNYVDDVHEGATLLVTYRQGKNYQAFQGAAFDAALSDSIWLYDTGGVTSKTLDDSFLQSCHTLLLSKKEGKWYLQDTRSNRYLGEIVQLPAGGSPTLYTLISATTQPTAHSAVSFERSEGSLYVKIGSKYLLFSTNVHRYHLRSKKSEYNYYPVALYEVGDASTSVRTVERTEKASRPDVSTLQGVRLHTDVTSLPKGIYIVNGAKKVIR